MTQVRDGSGPRIALLDTSDPGAPYGGQAAFLRAVAPYLDGVVSLYVGKSAGGRRCGMIELGTRTFAYRRIARTPAAGRRPLVPVRLKALFGVLRARARILEDSDVIYAHSPEMALPFVRGRRGRALVVHMHGNANPLTHSRYRWARARPLQWAYRRLMCIVMRAADAVIAVDADGQRMCASCLNSTSDTPIELVPTAVGDEWFDVGRHRQDSPPDPGAPPAVVFVARLEDGKGTDLLLDSLGLLMSDNPAVKATIAGEGSQRHEMEARSRDLRISGRVTFSGWVAPAGVMDLLSTATVMILPSKSEGMPISVLEALACGVPVVASAVGALPEMIEDGVNGAIVCDRTAAAFAGAIETVLNHPPAPGIVSASAEPYRARNVARRLDVILRRAADTARGTA